MLFFNDKTYYNDNVDELFFWLITDYFKNQQFEFQG